MGNLLKIRIFFFGLVALSFPLAAIAVFGFGQDRQFIAAILSVIYGFGLIIAMFASFLPLKELREWSLFQRVESLVLAFFGMSYFTHLSWEFIWLVAHKAIGENRDSPLTYAWWAYIDGGDARYFEPEIMLIVMEILSVTNGVVGMFALIWFLRSGRKAITPVLMMMGTTVVHLYSASLYYLTEILDGLPNVDTTSFIGTYIKFALANSPWMIVPFFAFWWANKRVRINAGLETA